MNYEMWSFHHIFHKVFKITKLEEIENRDSNEDWCRAFDDKYYSTEITRDSICLTEEAIKKLKIHIRKDINFKKSERRYLEKQLKEV